MKADQIITAFRGFLNGERKRAVSVLRQIEATETAAGRTTVAAKLQRLLKSQGRLLSLPKAPAGITFREPSVLLDSVVLSPVAATAVAQIVEEWSRREELSEHELAPRATILLSGPSGNGKTYLANAIARAVSLPLGIVDYGSTISSYRGATGGKIAEIMRFAQSTPCVVLFDEADSLLCSRTGADASGSAREDTRSVNQVLLELDAMRSRSLVIFATNQAGELDSALLRRLAVHIEMPAPRDGQREAFAGRIAARWPFLNKEGLRGQIRDAGSFAECEEVIRDAARTAVLSGQAAKRKA